MEWILRCSNFTVADFFKASVETHCIILFLVLEFCFVLAFFDFICLGTVHISLFVTLLPVSQVISDSVGALSLGCIAQLPP